MPKSQAPLTTNELRKALGTFHDGIRAEMRQNTKDIIDHHPKALDNALTPINTKLDAIMSGEVLVTRHQIENLLRELRTKGVEIDTAKVFPTP